MKSRYSWGFLALLQYFLLKSPPSGGESRAATVRERKWSVRSGSGALQRRSVRAASVAGEENPKPSAPMSSRPAERRVVERQSRDREGAELQHGKVRERKWNVVTL